MSKDDTAYMIGAAMMLDSQNVPVTGNDATAIAAISLATACALFGDTYTDEQLGVCVMTAKASYLLGRERAGFVGYG